MDAHDAYVFYELYSPQALLCSQQLQLFVKCVCTWVGRDRAAFINVSEA